jgi:hypothetical protein
MEHSVGKFINEWKTIGVGVVLVGIRFGSGVPRALSIGRESILSCVGVVPCSPILLAR